MKIILDVKVDLKTEEVQKKVTEATRLALRDTIVAIAADAIEGSPVKTGNNRRSIKYEVAGMGSNEMVDPNKLEAATYSTSGYGGFLETGTYKMAARPYFRPALDKNKDKLIPSIKEHLK